MDLNNFAGEDNSDYNNFTGVTGNFTGVIPPLNPYPNSWIISFNSPVNCSGVVYCNQIIRCE